MKLSKTLKDLAKESSSITTRQNKLTTIALNQWLLTGEDILTWMNPIMKNGPMPELVVL